MKNKAIRPRRLIIQISFIIITITTTLLSLFGSYRHLTNKKLLVSQIEKKSERLAKRLSESLSFPYYNYDVPSMTGTILSEMDDSSVIGIFLYEPLKASLEMGFIREKNGEIIKAEKMPDDLRLIRRKAKVIHRDEVLGQIFVYITTKYMEQQLKEGLVADVIQIVALDIFLMILVIFFFRIKFIRPIQSLTETAAEIAKGELDQVIDVRSNNEIGKLAESFRNMIAQLQQTLSKLKSEISERKLAEKEVARHRDHLEDMVRERTEELSVANFALKYSEEKSRSLLENSPDFIININRDLTVQYINKSMHGIAVEDIVGTSAFVFFLSDHNEELKKKVLNVFDTNQPIMFENTIKLPDGQSYWYENRVSPIIRRGKSTTELMLIITDITKRKQAEIELESVQNELIDKAHKAGMADIATGTLHNVGNILNSVLTSTQMMNEIMAASKMPSFFKANEILKENIDDLENFIIKNPKGKILMEYYLAIEKQLSEENSLFKQHLDRLKNKVNAIVEVINAQQSYAGGASFVEKVCLKDIIEDAITMQADIISSNNISIDRHFIDIPPLIIQRTKFVHIMINLIGNAKDAMLSIPAEKRILRFLFEQTEDAVFLKVSDSGEGISSERIQKIFSHGFTTKDSGHGFGLHSCANYMTEMGGRMWAESEGTGKGSTFILQFALEAERVDP